MERLSCRAAICILVTATAAWGQEKPSAAAKPAPATAPAKSNQPAAARPGAPAPQGTVAEPDSVGVKAIEAIFACVAQGLPQGWQRAWVTVTELSSGGTTGRTLEGRFQVSLEGSGDKRWDFVPCNSREVAERVYRLNEFLEPEKHGWKTATLLFLREGKFELKYDYSR